MNTEPEPLTFGDDIVSPDLVTQTVTTSPPRKGRPRKYATEEERKAARRERDRARRAAAKGETEAPPTSSSNSTGSEGAEGPDLFSHELQALKEAYKDAPKSEAKPPEPAPEAPKEDGPLMGYVLLAMVEVLAPVAVRWLLRRDTEGLSMTKAERERLEPLADRAAADMLRNATPAQLFVGAVFAVYAAKVPTLPKLEKKARKTSANKGNG